MQTIGNRIKLARKRLRLTQAKVAARTSDQVKQNMVSDYEHDLYAPGDANLLVLADALDVSPVWLKFGLNDSSAGAELVEHRKPIKQAPFVDWVEAGRFADTSDPYPIGGIDGTVAVSSDSDTLIALRVTGNSMDREFKPGTVIIVDYSRKELIDGRFYVFRIGGQATLKRWREDPPCLEPHSYDESHKPIHPKHEVEVVGQVIHSQRDYR
jgi:SOS-response transcriptional repressor LexA